MIRPGETRRFALPTSLRSLALPNYRRWAAADLISNIGSWMSTAALGWLVFRTTGSAAAMGAVIAVKQAPALVFSLVGGAFADRLNARRVLPFTQGGYALLAAALALLTWTGHAHLWQIYAFAVLTGTLSVLDGPCFGRLLAEVLGPRYMSNGIALGSITHSTGWVIGLGLGSAVLAGPGAAAVFAIDAASFVFVAVTVLRLRPELMHPLERAKAGRDRIRDGLRYVAGNRQLVVVLALGAVTGALGRHFQVTMAAMAETVFHGGPGLYGRLFTFFSVGAFVGATVAARLRSLRLPVLLTAAASAAVVQLASGLAPTVWAFAVGMLTVAACCVVYDTSVSTVVQSVAPGHLRGRVIAVQGLVSSLASMAGAPTLGWLADHLGARQALVIGGGVSLSAVLIAATVLAGSPRLAAVRTISAFRRARPSFELAA
jgi:MFS family permease